MSEINYKSKYQELKLKFMNSVDVAFRLGFEQGMQQVQQQQLQDQAAQAQQAPSQAPESDKTGEAEMEPGNNDQNPDSTPNDSAHPDGTELDQHIAQLQSMLGKSEPGSDEFMSLKKSLDGIQSVRNELFQSAQNHKNEAEMRKAEKAFKAISKAMKPKFSVGVKAKHNLHSNAVKAVHIQEQIVNDLMKAMDEEQTRASGAIADILSNAGVIKE